MWKISKIKRTPTVSPQYSKVSRSHLMDTRIITARKRSLGQGNIFRSVCQSFCSQWGRGSLYDVTSCLAAWSHVPSRMFLSLVPRSFGERGLCPGRVCPGTPPPPEPEKRAVRILLECFLGI